MTMTDTKRGRPAQTPDLDRVLTAINAGKYDERILEIDDALENRRDHLKEQLMERVRKVFGPNAEVVITKLVKPIESSNPFVNKAMRGSVVDDGILPGPYRTNPDDNNTYRINHDYTNGMIEITDPFGEHLHQIPKAEWETWESDSGDRSPLTSDDNSGSVPDNLTSTHQVPIGERHGPIIGGLSAADMVGQAGRG